MPEILRDLYAIAGLYVDEKLGDLSRILEVRSATEDAAKNIAKKKNVKEFLKAAFDVAFAKGMPIADALLGVGLDCVNSFLNGLILNQVKGPMDLIKDFIYPFLEIMDVVESQQAVECEFFLMLEIAFHDLSYFSSVKA